MKASKRNSGCVIGRDGRWRTEQKSSKSAKGEPTKPSKPGSVGFEGAPYVGSANIHTNLAGEGFRSIKVGLDCSTNTTRLMSWSETPRCCAGRLPAAAGT